MKQTVASIKSIFSEVLNKEIPSVEYTFSKGRKIPVILSEEEVGKFFKFSSKPVA